MPSTAAPTVYQYDESSYSPTAHFIGKVLYGVLEGAARNNE